MRVLMFQCIKNELCKLTGMDFVTFVWCLEVRD
jgi:hypothetical protein